MKCKKCGRSGRLVFWLSAWMSVRIQRFVTNAVGGFGLDHRSMKCLSSVWA